jgi:C1A family cysteine protease
MSTTEPTQRKVKRYGWKPDLPDHRDFLYAAPIQTLMQLPTQVDLRKGPPGMPEVYDQGDLGSCTANATAAAVQYARRKENRPEFRPSRLFIYYNTRAIEGTIDQDIGAFLRDTLRAVAQLGVCASDTHWPYDITQFAKRPPPEAYQFASDYQVVRYRRMAQSLNQMKGCLASGYPFVFGFSVYESFEAPEVRRTGNVPLPSPSETQFGGHAVLAVGYEDATSRFIVRNSWGPSWGDAGYCYMPYGYLTNPSLSADFWNVSMVEN